MIDVDQHCRWLIDRARPFISESVVQQVSVSAVVQQDVDALRAFIVQSMSCW